jgi:plasmid maintenance system antidote protein VapI
MDYKKIYDSLVEKAKVRGLDKSKHEGYFEIHHIIPRCMGGDNSEGNLVMFTAREHFIAHMLLYKSYPSNSSLIRAAFIMSSRWKSGSFGTQQPISSRVYEALRKQYSDKVRIQMSTNNHWKGRQHTKDSIERMLKSRRVGNRKRSLLKWKENNDKYMSQFGFSVQKPAPFVVTIEDKSYTTFNAKLDRNIWLNAQTIKDFWERSGNPSSKLLSTDIRKVSGKNFEDHKLRELVKRFEDGWEPSNCPSYVSEVLCSDIDFEDFTTRLSKTLKEVEDEYVRNWFENRVLYRERIENFLSSIGVEKHKNNSKAKLSLVDVAEALILWRSGLVEQKLIAEVLGVARNSISNAVEGEDRWQSVKDAYPKLMEVCFG